MNDFTRREVLRWSAGAAAVLAVGRSAAAQQAAADDTPWRGERIVDCHFHERASEESMIAHLDGCGATSALMLSFENSSARYRELHRRHPSRFIGWARGTGMGRVSGAEESGRPSPFDMAQLVTAGASREVRAELRRLRRAGWKGFAESGAPTDVDGPEMDRLMALASELDVPVMMHFQKTGLPGEPPRPGRGFSHIEPLLRKYPRARLVGHASDFWGHIDARYVDGGAYLTGKVAPGGLVDRMLAEHPNLYADLGAPSCLLQVGRDPEFTSGFLHRHQDKLMFGSDCGCADGRGGMAARAVPAPTPGSGAVNASNASAMQMRMAAMGGLGGKCIARELLAITWKSTDRSVFRKIAWDNAVRVYRLDA